MSSMLSLPSLTRHARATRSWVEHRITIRQKLSSRNAPPYDRGAEHIVLHDKSVYVHTRIGAKRAARLAAPLLLNAPGQLRHAQVW